MATSTKTLKNISEIRRFFHRNEDPIYFVSATNFNLLGMDEWCKNFKFISYIDCYDGQHPNTFCPSEQPHAEFTSIEDINNYLLQHKEVIDFINRRGGKPKLVFLMFDETDRSAVQGAGLGGLVPEGERCARAWTTRSRPCASATRPACPACPTCWPRSPATSSCTEVARKEAKLGTDLVLQSAFGDSGHTTFFIKSAADFRKHQHEIIGQGEIKVMKRINCRGSAIEACVTKKGTIVGPLMTELVGFGDLTPYRGGWCGNEIYAGAFTGRLRDKAKEYTRLFGEQLRKEGYRGYFELDFLIDQKSNDLYLGELNPRITGASSMTNHAAFAHADAPLFLFHLLEFSGVAFNFDIDELNGRWAEKDNIDSWCQMVDQAHRRHGGPDQRGAQDRHLAHERRRHRRATPASTTTAAPSRARRRPSSCASWTRATTATKAPTSASWCCAAARWTTASSCRRARASGSRPSARSTRRCR